MLQVFNGLPRGGTRMFSKATIKQKTIKKKKSLQGQDCFSNIVKLI